MVHGTAIETTATVLTPATLKKLLELVDFVGRDVRSLPMPTTALKASLDALDELRKRLEML